VDDKGLKDPAASRTRRPDVREVPVEVTEKANGDDRRLHPSAVELCVFEDV
jgi:hypothetical protein